MIYPKKLTVPLPHPDMPDDQDTPNTVKKLYEEARNISNDSPRASLALLRCSLEKLTEELGEKEGSLNQRIENLVVKKGLSVDIKDVLHSLRVWTNEAGAHVDCIDLSGDENAETVNQLFGIMNMIVERLITGPKEIENLRSKIPPNKKGAIASKGRDDA